MSVEKINPFQTFPDRLLKIVFLEVMRVSGNSASKAIRCFPGISLDESDSDGEREELSRLYYDLTGKTTGVLSVALVCKDWYTVAIDYPVLWTNLRITPYTAIAVINTWISRSVSLPLDITFDFTDIFLHRPITSGVRDNYVPTHAERISDAFNVLQQELDRWRGLSVTVISEIDMHTVLERLASLPVPSKLEDLRLVCDRHGRREVRPYPQRALFGGPLNNLKALRSQGIPSHVEYPGLMLNLAVLVLRASTGVVHLSWEVLTSVLRSSVLLESLTIWDIKCRDVPGWVHPKSVITLPRVSNLSIGHISIQFAAVLLDVIHLPSVKRLVLDFNGSSSAVVFRRLSAPGLHQRPLLCSIEDLTLVGAFAPDSVILNALKNLVSLVTLDLKNSWPFFNVLEQMALGSLEDQGAKCLQDHLYHPLLCQELRNITCSGIRGLALGAYAVARAALGFRLDSMFMRSEDVQEQELVMLRHFVENVESFDSV